MDTDTDRDRIVVVVEAYEALRRAADDLDRQNIGQAREAVTVALQSLAQYPIPVNV